MMLVITYAQQAKHERQFRLTHYIKKTFKSLGTVRQKPCRCQTQKRRKNPPWMVEQVTWIILEYGATRNITQARRCFGRKPLSVPCESASIYSVWASCRSHHIDGEHSAVILPGRAPIGGWQSLKLDSAPKTSRKRNGPYPCESLGDSHKGARRMSIQDDVRVFFDGP